jgi:hypothetical protein
MVQNNSWKGVKMKKLFIPTIGTIMTLAKDWAFDLYYEDRNEAMMARVGQKYTGWNREKNGKIVTRAILPKGSELKIDRIYIRKGKDMKDYDSVTFFLVGEKETLDRFDYSYVKTSDHQVETIKTPRKVNRPVRFWAKLDDVNNIAIEE